jgi:hypothetical protein
LLTLATTFRLLKRGALDFRGLAGFQLCWLMRDQIYLPEELDDPS